MFLISSWCGIAKPMDEEYSIISNHSNNSQSNSWESNWITSEPQVLSSEFGGGYSITMKWLAGQKQLEDCNNADCPQIEENANEWLQRDSLPLLLIFNRPGPSVETQEKLVEYGIRLNNNPWRDNIDTSSIDESKLVGSFDEEFVTEYTHEIILSEDESYDIATQQSSPPLDWPLGAWGAWVLANMGSETAMLHAPLSGNQDYWRIGDVWFASAKPTDVVNLVSNNIWDDVLKEIPNLVTIDLDLKIQIHAPLDEDRKWTGTDTELDVGIPPAWNHTVYNVPLRGDNIRIADFDTGIDVFHPAFFNPGATNINWIDDNNNSIFEWGIDGIDYDGNGQLSVNETLIRIANGDGLDSIHRDTYYLDLDENGAHNHGYLSGYNESSPGFGEPMYQANDQNSDGILSPNEYFMLLDESTILATFDPDSGECIRGTNLTQTAPDTNGHGTSVQGIIAANNAKHFYSGLAPNADLLSNDAFAGGFANAQSWATQRNADVMLYEVGSWTGEFLDGTSPVELSIDQMADSGIVQINPAGNLADSGKVIQGLLPDVDDSIGPLTTKFKVNSNNRPTGTWLTYLIPNGHNISFVEITKPGGSPIDVSSSTGWVDLGNNDWVWIGRDNSARNTNLLMLAFSNDDGLTADIWNIDLAGPTGQGRVLFRGYESDSISSWGGGSNWRNPSPSSLATIGDNGSVTWPATADSAITIASWASRGRGGVSAGELSKFSSRGTRINDGMPLVDIASPGNYDVWAPKTSQSGANFGSYHWFSGTSAAGPGAAASVALMLQDNPGVGHHGIWHILNSTAHWNSTTGELWNHSSRLSGAVGNPTDVVGAILFVNGTWGLSQPYGTPLGNGIRVGDPQPGILAPDVEWGWGYIRVDRATERDLLSPDIFIQSYVSFESFEPTDIPLIVDDNSIGDGNPLTMNVTCLENQNGSNIAIAFQENVPLGSINCTFESIGWNSILLEVTDFSNNKQNSAINVTTIFGESTQILSSSPNTHSITTDEILQLEGRVRNAWGAERPMEPQEWYDGLTPLNGFSIESSAVGSVNLNPIKTGFHNLSVNLYNSSIWFNIDVLMGANHHADFRTIPPSNGLTTEEGFSIFTPDEPIHFQIRWFDEDNNPGVWENYIGSDVGYFEVHDNFTENYISASDAEFNDSLIGHWNNNEFYPLRSGQINLWIGKENSDGELIKGKLPVYVEPGIPRELYLENLENNSIELEAGMPWTAKLHGYDLGYNTVEIDNYLWNLIDSTNELELAQSGLSQSNSLDDNHIVLTQNIAGEHLLIASYTRLDGTSLELNLMMNISPVNPEVLIVNPSLIEINAGDYFDVNFTLYDQYGNILDTDLINITYTSGICNCPSASGDWQITKSGLEYIYLESGEINKTVEITVSPSFVSQIELSIGGNGSLEVGESASLNLIGMDEYNNTAELELSSISFTQVDDGLTLADFEVSAVSGGNHIVYGKMTNKKGDEIGFEFSIYVWGDRDGDGYEDTIDYYPDDPDKNEMEEIIATEQSGFSEFVSGNYARLVLVLVLISLLVILGIMRNKSKNKRKLEESQYNFNDW